MRAYNFTSYKQRASLCRTILDSKEDVIKYESSDKNEVNSSDYMIVLAIVYVIIYYFVTYYFWINVLRNNNIILAVDTAAAG